MGCKLGISTWTFPWSLGSVNGYPRPDTHLTCLDLLGMAKDLEVQVLQIADNLPLHMMSDDDHVKLAVAASDLGIEMEIGTRGVEPGHLLRYLEIAKRLNAKLVRTLIDIEGQRPPDDLEQAFQWVGQVLPEFERYQVAIAIENYERHKVSELAEFVGRFDSEFIGICLDTVNSLGALEVESYVTQTLMPLTINLHVKDYVIDRIDHRMGFVVSGCAAGEGLLDIRGLLGLMGRGSRCPNIILEQWPPYLGNIDYTVHNELEWAVRGIGYLKHQLAGKSGGEAGKLANGN